MSRTFVVALVVLAALVVSGAAAGARRSAAATPEPGISVSFLPSPPTVVGRRTAMPIRVSNTWPGRAVGVTLGVHAPSWVRLYGAGCNRRRDGVSCALRDLDPGESVTVRLQISPQRLGSYRIVAQASAKTVVAVAGSGGGAVSLRFLAGTVALHA